MSAYDSSVIISCERGNEKACDVIAKDNNCAIPPTTWQEINDSRSKVSRNYINYLENHCSVYTWNQYPFNDFKVQNNINDFVTTIETNRMRDRGFKEHCMGSEKLGKRKNDWEIYKQSNILAEHEVVDTLGSGDWAHTHNYCQAVYERIMEEEMAKPEPKEIDAKFFKKM